MSTKRLTTKIFIERSKEIHDDKYDYSQVVYVNNDTKVKILCHEHGIFEQRSGSHIQGKGCPKCGINISLNKRTKNSAEFVKEAKQKHGNKYDYSLVDYKTGNVKVPIVCHIHGIFYQSPNYHIRGQGCSKCTKPDNINIKIFIEKATKIHGDRYDYSAVIYVHNKIKVKIICKEHEVFEQTPFAHFRGSGCMKCSRKSQSDRQQGTIEDFINKSIAVHGNKYDYSKTLYVNSMSKVEIICPEHGSFMQTPSKHVYGRGCRKCANKNNSNRQIKSNENFIKEALEIHGNKYNYSKVDYKTSTTKVSIICIKHGLFMQSPSVHLGGHGCPLCAKIYRSNTEEFVKNTQEIHGLFYDYSKVEYFNRVKKVTIICPVHGEFKQMPNSHLNGSGCVKCGGESISVKNRLTQDEFLLRCKKVHGNKYDYSLVVYEKCYIPVKIICPKHGVFKQVPNSHMCGIGCSSCNESHGEIAVNINLQNRNLHFNRQHRFVDCINIKTGRKLSFDFFVPAYNLCIEFDGAQHFGPYDKFGGNVAFEHLKYLDSIKNQYCVDKGIGLLRINYKDKDFIDQILTQYFADNPIANFSTHQPSVI